MTPWKEKANRLISNLSHQAWKEANFRNGKQLKRYVPYTIPPLARELVECLDTDNEERAKALFMTYDGLAAI